MAGAFFAYPSRPEVLAETLRASAASLDAPGAPVCTWQQLLVGGRVVIQEIMTAIRSADVVAAEVTDLNRNVLFELGYAIGSNKRVFPLGDRSREALRNWDDLTLLRGLGLTQYVNADEIVSRYHRENPALAPMSAFEQLIEPGLRPSMQIGLFYMKAQNDTEPARRVTRRIDAAASKNFRVRVADPSEGKAQNIQWYAQSVYDATSVLVHLESDQRRGARLHNARYSLIAGLAVGMGKPVLMVAEDGVEIAFDYADLLFVYPTAAQLVAHVETWLEPYTSTVAPRPVRPVRLGTELAELRIGEYVAENEEDGLASYFIETAAYRSVVDSTTVVFVGRKGTGKTANLLRAAQALAVDRRNLVVVVRPAGYEFNAVVRLLARYSEKDEKGYLIESLWKFLLYTEIARSAVAEIETRPAGPQPGSDEWKLVDYATDHSSLIRQEFAVRLEQAVDAVLTLPVASSVGETRAAIAETLHEGVLRDLRELLGRALQGKERVAVLVDNLDKPWEKGADFELLSQFLLGLIATIRPVASELAKKDRWREPVRTTMSVFLRSDIFDAVASVAREPDKLPVVRLEWEDPELLARVIEERFLSSRPDSSADELWSRFFVGRIDGATARDRLLRRVMPRPRDLIYLTSTAIANAVNRRSDLVDVESIRAAERDYSQFAVDSILVEASTECESMDEVIYEFAGAPAVLNRSDALRRVRATVGDEDRANYMLSQLRSLAFLGVEVAEDRFSFSEEARDRVRDEALARGLAARRGTEVRYQVHPAFRPYLEIEESAL